MTLKTTAIVSSVVRIMYQIMLSDTIIILGVQE